MTTYRTNQSSGKTCAHQGCNSPTSRPDHPLCRQHFHAAQYGLINKCSRCENFKPTKLPLCGDCFIGAPKAAGGLKPAEGNQDKNTPGIARHKYAVESSPVWEAGDASATEFYVYILRLTGGRFYIGQTRELPERLSEHRDGRVASTKDRSPSLVWFTELPSREEAAKLEFELKQMRDRDERAIRRMIVRFQSLVRELDKD